jgi:hypothetical protein
MYKTLVICLLLAPLFSISQLSTIDLAIKPIPKPSLRDTAADNWNLRLPAYHTLSDKAKDILYWTNFCRANPQKFWDSVISPILIEFPNLQGPDAKSLKEDLLNTGSLPMFTLNNALLKTSLAHAKDISRKPSPPSHNSTDGTDFGTRMNRAGIKTCASENIAIGYQEVLVSVILLYLDIGLPEHGHRKSLLNPTLVEIGIGCSPYGKEGVFTVEDFACKQ